MADLEEIAEDPRTGEGNDSRDRDEKVSTRGNSIKRRRARGRRNTGGSQSRSKGPSLPKEDGDWEQVIQHHVDSEKQDAPLTREYHRAQFYKNYRQVAQEHDKEFLKKHDEDLNTTLIFAGLFSAVTSAFIIEVDSHLQQDPNEETAALLRVLIYKIDNTAFGNNVPPLPQWAGPPRAIVHVQAILFASLVASLLSAFLAMLGKQWLNHYESTDARATAIERSQNRQRKLDGIVGWYFGSVMGALPLMLQASLLLFSCALGRYLWEIDTTIASVVLGVASFGVFFYLFIVIAGAFSENFPYQTPGAHILRNHLLPSLRSTPSRISDFIKNSQFYSVSTEWRNQSERPWYLRSIGDTFYHILYLYGAIAFDVYYLAQAILRSLVPFGQKTLPLDFRCILWMLQESVDKAFHLSAFKYLTEIPEVACVDPSIVINVLIRCINIVDGKAVVVQGLEKHAAQSARCFLRMIRHLLVIDPTRRTLTDLRRRYGGGLPLVFGDYLVDFGGLPFRYTMIAIRILVEPYQGLPTSGWNNDIPSVEEHIELAWCVAEVAQLEYQWGQRVSSWILCFVFDSLSLDPPPQPSVVANCLKIIAVDLGCDVSNIRSTDESVRPISDLITQKLDTMVESPTMDPTYKHRSISALLPYAISLEQSGDKSMVNALFSIARTSNSWRFKWSHIEPYMNTLLSEPTHPSNQATTLLSLYAPCDFWDENTIHSWVAAVSATPYSEEDCSSVVETLSWLASRDHLRPHIPNDVWTWLKTEPPLPPACVARSKGTRGNVVRHVRELGDPDILKSYFVLVWSEWGYSFNSGFDEAKVSIVEDLGGVEMQHYREDLIQRLDHILGELDRGLEHLKQHEEWITEGTIQRRKEQYGALREMLLEADRTVVKHL